MLEPTSIDELIAAVKERPKMLPVGGRTKPQLSTVDGVGLLSLKKLTGITQYEPSEYTFTALAGTPVCDVRDTLAERGQYMPFDPCLVSAGATLGGTVASGISGAGRFRFGGVRDFLIGVRFIDGTGRLLSGGGKVVKNAAGFDTPKLMVGSLGRLGVLAELTFKVFPKPESLETLQISCASHVEAMNHLTKLAGGRWELDALDYRPADKQLFARVGGPAAAVNEMAGALEREINASRMIEAEADSFWSNLSELGSTSIDTIVSKIPVTPKAFLKLQAHLDSIKGCSTHLSGGGAFVWLSLSTDESFQATDAALRSSGLGGLVIKGATPSMWIGQRPERAIDAAVKKVFDPESRFPTF